ncbi:MAG: dihydroneopterin aldolase family protein [Aigarchaeota archaeon]|nr:dihydroneopterin aldolase family protein [Candidatus Pelearchaeum maunauluense]
MNDVERLVRRLFPNDFTDRERAIFEAGIALGSIAHTLAGIPISRSRNLQEQFCRALSGCFLLQPYRKRVKIRFRGVKKAKRHEYDYETVSPDKLDIIVETQYGDTIVRARMRYIERLAYPVMYVEKVKDR